jgi:hypothetical protein
LLSAQLPLKITSVVPLRAPDVGGGLPPAGALVPEPVPVVLVDMVVIVGFWGLTMVLAIVCCRITGTVGCVVRGSDPCRDAMGVRAVASVSASSARVFCSVVGGVGSSYKSPTS